MAYPPVENLATYLMSHIQQDYTITNEQKRRASLMLKSPMIITQLLQGNYLKMKGFTRREALSIENDQSRSWEIQYEGTNLRKKYLKLILSPKTFKYYGSHNQVSQKHVYQAIYDYNGNISYEKNDTDVLVRRANSIFVGSYQYHPCGYNKSITENSNRERVYLKNLGKEDDHTCYALLEMRLTHQNKLLEEYNTTKTNSEQTQDQEGRHILEQDVARLRAQLHDYEIKQTISGQTQGQIDRDILEKNVIRLGAQFLAIVGRGCMQLDCFMGHNIVCKTIPNSDGSETKQLNVIDFQSLENDRTGIDIMDCFITKLIEDTQCTDLQKSMLESNAKFNRKCSSIFTMLAYCVLVEQGFKCGANTTITSSQQAIYNEARTTRINMVKILMSGDVDVVQSRRAFKKQFESNCLGLGEISEAMIHEQYNELGIPVRFRTPRPRKEVKLITCEQLETSSLHAPK